MGANFAEFLPLAVAAGGQGTIQGMQQGQQMKERDQLMALRATEEGRTAQMFPEQLTAVRNDNALYPLKREQTELAVRGGRPVGDLYGRLLRKPARLDRDAAEFLYQLEEQKAMKAEQQRLARTNQERDDQLAWFRQSQSRLQAQVSDAEQEVGRLTSSADKARRDTQALGLSGEQKRAAMEQADYLDGKARAAGVRLRTARTAQQQAEEEFRKQYKERFGEDPGGIPQAAVGPQTSAFGTFAAPAGGNK